MQKLHTHPETIPGAATYWATGCNVVMRDSVHGITSVIETKRTEGAALDAAKRWQEKEHKAVIKEAKRLASKA